MQTTTSTRTRAARPRQAARTSEITGLSRITDELTAVLNYRVDRATVGRWFTIGVRDHKIAGRRVGNRWVTTHAALEAFARASGALPEGDR